MTGSSRHQHGEGEAETREEGEGALQALIESEERYRTLVETMGDGLAITDREGVVTYVNEAFCRMLDRPESEVLGRPALTLVHEDDHDGFRSEFARRAAGQEGQYEQRLVTRSGKAVYTLVTATPRYDAEGEFAGSFAVIKDISERKQALQALEESEARFRELADLLPQVVFETDEQGRLTLVNRNAFAALGYTPDDLEAGVNVMDTLIPEDRGRAADEIEMALRGEGPSTAEYTALRKDGTTFAIVVDSSPIVRNGKAVGLRAIGIDISERKELEAQLLESQKMEAMGQIAGGVAHDFNNMLTAIHGNAQLLQRELADEPDRLRLVEGILTAARRSAELTRHLLAFSRKQVLRPRVIDLNEMVGNIEPMLRRIIPENIRIVTALSEHLGQVEADPAQIEQVIVNLAVNARDAMPDGGTLSIRTANVILDDDRAGPRGGVAPGAYVMLAVSDTGIGMDEVTQSQVFDPFFTTRKGSGGTGLGLSTVYGIVRQTGGDVCVRSELGEGSTLEVYVPMTEAEAEAVPSPHESGADLRGSETVLVVEDEDVVRSLIAELLQRFGYTVLQAENADAALEVCRQGEGQIDLLVTDVVMPGTDGVELAETVTEMMPNIGVLYVSGYTDRALAFRDRLDERMRYMQKPFEVQEFIATIREMLDAPH